MLSGLAIDSNDPLSRRDQGLEFRDVTAQAIIARIDSREACHDRYEVDNDDDHRDADTYRITNRGTSPIDTHLLVIATGLPRGVEMENASGTTKSGAPFRRIFLPNGVLEPGQSIVVKLRVSAPATYSLKLLSGQGVP